MSGENGAQQGHRTPRAKHKHSRSAAGPVSDSEGFGAQTGSGQKRPGTTGNRKNQQARNAPQAVSLSHPGWQDGDPSQLAGAAGFFDAHGNFVSSAFQLQNGQAPGMFYMSDGVPSQGAHHQKKKGRQGKSGRHLNGANTPPHASSDTEQIMSAAMLQTMTPAKAAAYAGPTFHASPAANALPIPKFFSKSVPNDAAQVGLEARLAREPEKSDSSDKAESPPAVQAAATDLVPNRSNESPLDFLFKADKEQKAKRQSAGITLTPPANKPDGASPDPARANPWQSIYGTGPRNHQRQASNGSGRDMFMMELDGREASPRPKHVSPPPPLPRIPIRSVSDHTTLPQLSPQSSRHNSPQAPRYPPIAPAESNPSGPAPTLDQRSTIDHSYSPFNRAGPYPTPRSNETTPTPQQHGLYAPQSGLHYGNRNLSPLFQAAKESTRPPSGLRQELYQSPIMAELPDSSPSRPANPHRRASTQAEKAALAFLQTRVPNATAMPALPLPRASPSELDGAAIEPAPTGVTPPAANAFNAKSIEDDLKRMLKLTGGFK